MTDQSGQGLSGRSPIDLSGSIDPAYRGKIEVQPVEHPADRRLRLVKEYISFGVFIVLAITLGVYLAYTAFWHVGSAEDQAWSRTLLTSAFTGYLGWILKR
ncbi:hypothetical protein ACFW16_19510 [Inquilinus sp. NPDC058860]|uniref:hypothetical protein n=1 Tax=Inquilinus sp. NPDC058860 TaxID=3346652 RepID=UPI0036CAEEBC